MFKNEVTRLKTFPKIDQLLDKNQINNFTSVNINLPTQFRDPLQISLRIKIKKP